MILLLKRFAITYGIGFTLELKKQNDSLALHRNDALAVARVNIIFYWCIPSSIPSIAYRIYVEETSANKDQSIDFADHEKKTFFKNADNSSTFSFD